MSSGSQIDAISVNATQDARLLDATTRDLIARRAAVFGPSYRLQYARPVTPVRASGTKIYDASGEVLLDAYNNVPCIGHAHPRVIRAMSDQLAMVSTNTRYLQDRVVAYAEKLIATFDAPLDRVMFTCTGSEANDLAMRIARHVTGQKGVIASEFAYHGTTSLVSEFSPSGGVTIPLGRDVRLVPPPDPGLAGDQSVGAFLASHVQAQIDDLRRHGVGIAAMVFDGLFSSDGIYPGSAEILRPAIDVVHRAGGLVILDEVQSGFARTGSHLWGHQHFGIQPDLVTMGKPMANGLPVAAVVADGDLFEDFGAEIPYFNTFAGNTGCIAAADAVLDVIHEENLLANVARQGERLRGEMRRIVRGSRHSFDLRGAGTYIGLAVHDPSDGSPLAGVCAAIVNDMRERGVLISAAGPDGNVLKIRPPLVFDDSDTDRFLSTFESVIKQTA